MRLDDKTGSIDRDTDLAIDRDVHKIEFFPEIINYTHDDPTVSYYLEGFEKDWTNVRRSELISVQYTNLDPGNYTFHLAIRDDGGNIVEESQYRFHKQKAIYDNGWFMIYVIGVAGVFVGWLTWFITRTRIQRTLELQQTKLSMALQQVQMGNETILAIAKTVDAKDLRTSKHSQRVSEYSAMIAHEYGFTDDEVENLRKAALLHDIGKIGIPDSVLNKPARLTDEEYAVMKTHVTRGAEILKDFTLIDHVVEGARFHHERFDGRGYPDGLEGEQIPLYGRIIAIADAFDAMTANRVYRKRQDFDYVMGELHKGRGTQFDPQLLDIFLKLIDDKKIDIDALYKGEHQKDEEEQQ
ncbi:MAG: HD domain-containing protein, partial [Ruminococcus sp.]|nr:HD domain-containing protein [Ruminococcus sp.]